MKLAFLVAVFAISMGCGSSDSDTPAGAADGGTDGPGADAAIIDPSSEADPQVAGPYRVGVCTAHARDESRDRDLTIDVWYPVDPGAPVGAANTYEVEGLPALGSLPSPALRDATPIESAAPVILFSHGFGGVRFQSFFLTEHLASHGFVVASPDHVGNRLNDFGQLGDDTAVAQSAVDRPVDMAFTLDWIIDGEACAAVEIDEARVGITGHSFGAWTALESARTDDRLIAVFPLAPGFRAGSTPDFVAELGIPILVFGGTEDHTTPLSDQQAAYDAAQKPKHLAVIEGAGHLDFSNLCDVPIAKGFIDDGCDPTKIEPADVQARVNTLGAAFAHRYVAGHAFHDSFLEPSSASSLGKLSYSADR